MRKLAAIMFTDIVGYTALMGKDEHKALDLLHKNRDFLKPLIRTYNGEWLKEIGDGTLSSFASAVEAVNCALEIQQTLLDNPDLRLRIGIHIGDVVFEGGDVFGDGVNVASRIEPIAEPGGICVSEQIYDSIRNKPDIGTAFLGAKMLKNVDHPIKVYALTGEGLPTPSTEIPIAEQVEPEGKIKGRPYGRLGTIMGLYIAAGLGIVVFVDWLVNRYVLSPHLPDFSLVALLSMIPSIALLAYYHGTPGRYAWTRVERIGIPANLLATAVILFVFFRGTDLGAAQKTVTVEDEEGNKIERIIPKSEFRKKIALFFFENESGDSTWNWLQYGIPDMLHTDLFQDLFIEVKHGYESDFLGNFYIYSRMKEAGYPEGVRLPLTLKRKISDDLHLRYFVSGSFAKENEQFSVKTSLYETRRGKLLEERTSTGEDIFQLVDKISVQLKHDLKVPDRHVEEVVDLPVSEVLTNSLPALSMYIAGVNALVFNDDWQGAQQHLEQSIKRDPTFAIAHATLIYVYSLSNQPNKSIQALQSVMQYLYKLPERLQFPLRAGYYGSKQDPVKQIAVLKQWVELSPEDILGHQMLALAFLVRNEQEEVISEYKRILDIDPEQYDYLQKLGSIYKRRGEYDEALKYYGRYAEQFPNKFDSFTAIGGLYLTLGDYEKAKASYVQALLLEPGKVSILTSLAAIERKLGNLEEALGQYEEALALSKTPQDSTTVYDDFIWLYEMKGQLGKSIEYMNLSLVKSKTYQAPLAGIMNKLMSLDRYIMAGEKEVAFQIIERIKTQLTAPSDMVLPLGYLKIYLALGDAENAENAVKGVEALIQATQMEIFREEVDHAVGRIHEMRGEYEQAITRYEKELELDPTDASINRHIGRCYRKLKEFEKAEEYMLKTLKRSPFGPKTHYEIALVYADMGDQEKAVDHLKIALYVWEEADPEYKPAKKAREKLAEWEAVVL